MIFSNFFKKFRQDREYEPEYDQSEYATLQTENIVTELKQSEEVQTKNYVVDLCEQLINTSNDLSDAKEEYQLVTNYLNDIQVIEDLGDKVKKPLAECASYVSKLEQQRTDFLKTERRISDTQFEQMQEEEEHLPGIISRLKSNESYLDAIKKDMAYLEGKKLEWTMQRNTSVKVQKKMRQAAVYLFALFATLMALLGILSWYMKIDLALPMTIAAIIAVAYGGYVLIRFQNSSRSIRQADVNRNHAVTLENHVKIKYVNIKNAVDFVCEKYHVKNAYELQFLFEQYQKEARDKEQFRKTSDELNYYSKTLIEYLQKLRLYDSRVWINHANAIVDSRELVELKHNLITRRQKIRGRIEYSIRSIEDMKKEIIQNMDKMGNQAPQILDILRKIEVMNSDIQEQKPVREREQEMQQEEQQMQEIQQEEEGIQEQSPKQGDI